MPDEHHVIFDFIIIIIIIIILIQTLSTARLFTFVRWGGSQLETSVVCFTWKTWIRRSIVVNIGQLISFFFSFYKVYVIKKILWLPSFFSFLGNTSSELSGRLS